ncbi:hypothetical protein V6Z77_000954 [Aspergillus fumigatus]
MDRSIMLDAGCWTSILNRRTLQANSAPKSTVSEYSRRHFWPGSNRLSLARSLQPGPLGILIYLPLRVQIMKIGCVERCVSGLLASYCRRHKLIYAIQPFAVDVAGSNLDIRDTFDIE